MSDLMLDVGQANELKMAFRRHGWDNTDVKWLTSGSVLADVLRLRRGDAAFTNVPHVIDCDVEPSVLKRDSSQGHMELLMHRPSGKLVWDPARVELFNGLGDTSVENCPSLGLNGGFKRVWSGWAEPRNRKMLTAHVAFFLNDHPWLIPASWWSMKKRPGNNDVIVIYFGGTTYLDYWNDGKLKTFRGKPIPVVVGLVLSPGGSVFLTYDNPFYYYRDPDSHYMAVFQEKK